MALWSVLSNSGTLVGMLVSIAEPLAPGQSAAGSAGVSDAVALPADAGSKPPPPEVGGPPGPEPTRYGDWEKLGRCIDF